MEEIVRDMKALQVTLIREIGTLRNELAGLKKALLDLGEVSRERDELEEQNQEQRKCLWKMQNKVDEIESIPRRNNLMFRGLQELEGATPDDDMTQVREIGDRIGVPLGKKDIEMVQRLPGRPPRLVRVKFSSWRKKVEMLKRKASLRGSQIHIQEDFTKTVAEQRRILMEKAKQRRKDGEYAKVNFNKLFTSDGVFSWDFWSQNIVNITSIMREETMKKNRKYKSSRMKPAEMITLT